MLINACLNSANTNCLTDLQVVTIDAWVVADKFMKFNTEIPGNIVADIAVFNEVN